MLAAKRHDIPFLFKRIKRIKINSEVVISVATRARTCSLSPAKTSQLSVIGRIGSHTGCTLHSLTVFSRRPHVLRLPAHPETEDGCGANFIPRQTAAHSNKAAAPSLNRKRHVSEDRARR